MISCVLFTFEFQFNFILLIKIVGYFEFEIQKYLFFGQLQRKIQFFKRIKVGISPWGLDAILCNEFGQ